jgi:hypothetical protein
MSGQHKQPNLLVVMSDERAARPMFVSDDLSAPE